MEDVFGRKKALLVWLGCIHICINKRILFWEVGKLYKLCDSTKEMGDLYRTSQFTPRLICQVVWTSSAITTTSSSELMKWRKSDETWLSNQPNRSFWRSLGINFWELSLPSRKQNEWTLWKTTVIVYLKKI